MRALISHAPGGPETLVLGELADPRPAPGQMLLQVHACGVNYPDALLIRDRYQVKVERPFSPGGEVCATVRALGEGVSGFVPGDLVIGRCGWGGMAERLALDAGRCTRIPADTPRAQAAAFLLTYATAYHALVDCAGIRPGETLLVLGAGGGVGSAAVELGRALGARVLATASSEAKLAFAKGKGAQDGARYPSAVATADEQKALAGLFKALAGPAGADVIFDPVGGPYTEAALRAIARRGRHLIVGFTAGIPRIPANLPLLKTCSIVGVDWRALNENDPATSARNNAALLAMWADGRVRPTVTACYRLADAAQAIARMEARDAIGKMVIEPGG